MSESPAGVFRFNDCELHLAARELRRGGEVVPLEPRVFALLAYLIEHRGRAVDKDEIQDAVWTRMVATETALTRAIMKARRAVGDSADMQAVIRTVHGHGYQFVAKLEDAEPAPRRRRTAKFDLRPGIVAAAIGAAVIALVVALWPAAPLSDDLRIAVMPIRDESGDPEYGWVGLGLLGYARDLLVQDAALGVVEASEAIRFSEVHGQPDEAGAPAALEQLADLYGASHLLLSRLEKNANVLRLSFSLHGPGERVERGTMVGADPSQLLRGMVRSVHDALGVRGGRTNEITLIAEDPFINEAYSRGLALALEGRCNEALELFEVVLANSDDINRAHYQWASCARIAGRWQEAEAAFKRILDEVPVEPANPLRAIAAHGLGTVYIRTGRSAEARDVLAQGLAEAQQVGDRKLQGMILNNLAIEAKDRREHSEARDLLARSIVAYTEANTGILPGQIPAALANIDMAEGNLADAEIHLDQALGAFRATGDRRNEAMMLNNMGYLRRLQGRIDEAEPLHLESLEIRREIGDRVGQGRILGMLSVLYENERRYEDAKAAAREAHDIASAANDKLFMATSLAQLAQAEFSSSNLDAAVAAYEESGEIFESIDDYSRAAQVKVRLARIDKQRGDLDAADAKIGEVLALSMREALHEPMLESIELAGDIALDRGDAQAAVERYRDTLRRIEETGFVVTRTRVTIKLANLLLDSGDIGAAEPLIGNLIGEGESADALRVRARYAFESGDAARAVELMEDVRKSAAAAWTARDDETMSRFRDAIKD